VVEDESLPPALILQTLAAQGLTRVLIEAGPTLSSAFLAAQLVDQLYWYQAPILLGNTGLAAIHDLNTSLASASIGSHQARITLGNDHCDIYDLAPCSQA